MNSIAVRKKGRREIKTIVRSIRLADEMLNKDNNSKRYVTIYVTDGYTKAIIVPEEFFLNLTDIKTGDRIRANGLVYELFKKADKNKTTQRRVLVIDKGIEKIKQLKSSKR